MTEEDTFNRLKRIDINSLCKILNDLPVEEYDKINNNHESRANYLKQYGWEYEDFQIAVLERK